MNLICDVSAGFTNNKTGLFSPVSDQRNLVLFEGADIMASLLAGDSSAAISHLYLHYKNGGTNPVPLSRDMGRSWFDGISGANFEDWLRIPIITTPRLFRSPSSSPDYKANAIHFTGTSAASETMVGESPTGNYFGDAGPQGASMVFAAALVSGPQSGSSANDRIFSRVNLALPLTMVVGSQITIFWSVKLS